MTTYRFTRANSWVPIPDFLLPQTEQAVNISDRLGAGVHRWLGSKLYPDPVFVTVYTRPDGIPDAYVVHVFGAGDEVIACPTLPDLLALLRELEPLLDFARREYIAAPAGLGTHLTESDAHIVALRVGGDGIEPVVMTTKALNDPRNQAGG